MIYTITLNPSLDYVLWMDGLQVGETNYSSQSQLIAGGKGINVSRMLKNLGVDSIATGFAAGRLGDLFIDMVGEYGLKTDFIRVDGGETRINVKIKDTKETEINAAGMYIDHHDEERLFDKLSILEKGDVLVLAGSVPPGLSKDIYGRILASVKDKALFTVVDAAGDALRNALPHEPYLIKPNLAELSQFFGVPITEPEEIVGYAEKLRQLGAGNVLVSLGKEGAVLVDEHTNHYRLLAPEGKVVNSVGAGDSMVAGFVAGMLECGSVEHAFKLAVSCGSASTFSCMFGTKEKVKSLYDLLTLT